MGGLSPAYLAEFGSVTSSSARSILWEAWSICSKMARVGERQALQEQEEFPVHDVSPSVSLLFVPEAEGGLFDEERALPPPLLSLLGGMPESAKLTCAVGVLMDDNIDDGMAMLLIDETGSGDTLFESREGG